MTEAHYSESYQRSNPTIPNTYIPHFDELGEFSMRPAEPDELGMWVHADDYGELLMYAQRLERECAHLRLEAAE